jgi:O-methyltransferase
LLRKAASAIAKRLYRLRQASSRHAVDSHLEQYIKEEFIAGDYGAAYGVTRADRALLVSRIARVLDHVPSATRMLYHVVLARGLLSLAPSVEGDVVECGAYKGASSASLSLACALVRRRLWVCDSFAGLPSAEDDITRNYAHLRVRGRYEEGMYAGALDEVRGNVAQYGAPASCEFIKGLFAGSLEALPPKVSFAFVDVDLTSSMQDCIRHLWPRLSDGGFVYTDDSCDMEVVRVWFDDAWWRENLRERAPGYVGSGAGLPLAVGGSSLGYVHKVADLRKAYQTVSWLRP